MKVVRDHIWTDDGKDGLVKVGFTRRFIDQKLMECFHVLPADTKSLYEGGPMLVIETNDGLESIKSPVTGSVHWFNAKARNFPDRLTEDEAILTILPKGIVLPEAKAKAKSVPLSTTMEEFFDPFDEAQEELPLQNEARQGGWVQQGPQVPNVDPEWLRNALNQVRGRR